ncbi:hypothetical protein QE152_g8303 [Popillia japonica]|uniref:Uncharacterized protein n=1 Tax=Popillia japonica TaxID=7064 RepID=A0AAW1MBJ1_POPJA
MNLPVDLADVNQINRHFFGFMSVGDVDAAVIDYYNTNINATDFQITYNIRQEINKTGIISFMETRDSQVMRK